MRQPVSFGVVKARGATKVKNKAHHASQRVNNQVATLLEGGCEGAGHDRMETHRSEVILGIDHCEPLFGYGAGQMEFRMDAVESVQQCSAAVWRGPRREGLVARAGHPKFAKLPLKKYICHTVFFAVTPF